jgi:hypothetical protein
VNTISYVGKWFTVTFKPFPDSDVLAERVMVGTDADQVRQRFNQLWNGDIVSIEERL